MTESTMALADKYHQSGTHYEGRTMTESNARALLDAVPNEKIRTLLQEAYGTCATWQDADMAKAAYEAGRLAVLEQMKGKSLDFGSRGMWTIEDFMADTNQANGNTYEQLLAHLDAQEGV